MLRCVSLIVLLLSVVGAERFSEELLLRKLPDGHIYAHFSFVVERTSNDSHYSQFPKSLAEVFAQYDVDELHLAVSQGLWRHSRWGYPLHSESPPGTELWTWFKPEVSNVDKQWKRLTSALSGAFCTSLQFMDTKSTSTPRFAYRMDGVSLTKQPISRTEKHFVRYAALPGETPCTNTLTPWTKLLPCHSKAGLGSLLEPHSIFSASYASLGLHYIHTCPAGVEQCSIPNQQITLSLALVYNPKTTNLAGHISLRRMFTRDIQSSCVLASSSKILVDHESFQSDAVATPPASAITLNKYHEYDLTAPIKFSLPFDLNIRFSKTLPKEVDVPITVHRYLAGYGQQSGTVVCQINNDLRDHVPIIYTQTIPWFIYMYLHSLKIVSTGPNLKHGGISIIPTKMHYTPSRLRENIALLELTFLLPPESVTTITLDLDYQLLRWTEYPPDANHGFYINSATISVVLPAVEPTGLVIETLPREFATLSEYLKYRSDGGNSSTTTHLLRLYTESLIVYLPTPDFSMPYNALCLVCTVVAIGFGSVHSLTTKRFILVDPLNPPATFFTKVKAALKSRFSKKDSEDSKADQDKKPEKQD